MPPVFGIVNLNNITIEDASIKPKPRDEDAWKQNFIANPPTRVYGRLIPSMILPVLLSVPTPCSAIALIPRAESTDGNWLPVSFVPDAQLRE